MSEFVRSQRNKTQEVKNTLNKHDPRNVDRLKEANYIAENYPHLASIPDFNMPEFTKANAFSIHTARELLMILLDHGLTLNYNRDADGLSPIHFAIRHKDPHLLRLLMKVKNTDANLRARYTQNEPVNSKYYHEQPTLHMLVLTNDYELMKIFLSNLQGQFTL